MPMKRQTRETNVNQIRFKGDLGDIMNNLDIYKDV